MQDAMPEPANEDEDLAAVRDAVAEWRAGDPGLPLAAAFDEVRRAGLDFGEDNSIEPSS